MKGRRKDVATRAQPIYMLADNICEYWLITDNINISICVIYKKKILVEVLMQKKMLGVIYNYNIFSELYQFHFRLLSLLL